MSSSVLGESWVVASMHADRDDTINKNLPVTPKRARPVPDGDSNHGSPSSSMSGPELIMPSIYEMPVTEASWVAPNVRPKQTIPSLRRRHPSSAERAPKAEKPVAVTKTPIQNAHSTTTPKHRFALLETPIRTLTNIILLAAIAHLLILPELVTQYPSMCSTGPISVLYPSSCVPPYHGHHHFNPHGHTNSNSQSTPLDTILSSQVRLEYLFNTTLHQMAPLNNSLKQTESQLRTVERELKRAHPGTKHELDLEFGSCWRAIRIAGWKFDSLKVDLQSAVDSLVAAGDLKPRSNSKFATSDARSSVAHDTRISTQMLRRENYIAQLMARMRSKADSLAADLATLDDHLESIEGIVDRKSKGSSSSGTYLSSKDGGSSGRLGAFVNALPSFLRSRDHGVPEDTDSDDVTSSSPKLTLSQIFHKAATHHRPVAGLARNLSRELQQNKR
ncbi:hypothetical protein BDV06DRAFT_134591 [Aspergillus oleicola]